MPTTNEHHKEISETITEERDGSLKIVHSYKFWKDETLASGAAISTVMTYADQAIAEATLPARGAAFPRDVLGIAKENIVVVGRSGGHLSNQPNILRYTVTYEYKAPGHQPFPLQRKSSDRVISSMNMEPLNEKPEEEKFTPNGEPIDYDIPRYAQTYTETWDDVAISTADANKVGKVESGDTSKLFKSYTAQLREDENGQFYSHALTWIIHPDGNWTKNYKIKGHKIKNSEGDIEWHATPEYIKSDGKIGATDGSDAATIQIAYPTTA
jgi:hypothetical protein